jgi:anti-anti-sigma factor
MEIAVEQATGNARVMVLKPAGNLDAATYQELIAAGERAVQGGAQNLLLDLSGVSYMSSAGLVALHRLALLMRGEAPLEAESGWEAMNAIRRDADRGVQEHFKLCNPQPRVAHVLKLAGFDGMVEIYDDLDQAVQSFK